MPQPPDVVYRFAPDLDTTDDGHGGLTGLLLPWDTVATVADADGVPYEESWAAGALRADPPLPVYAGHDPVTGRRGPLLGAATVDSRDDGLFVDVAFADTAGAREVRSLARLVRTGLSIEARPDPAGDKWDQARRKVLRTAGELTGLAVVLPPDRPAYPDAQVLAIRSEPTETTSDTTTIQEDPVPDVIDDQADDDVRRAAHHSTIDTVRSAGISRVNEAAPVTAFRTFGEYVQGVARQDPDALAVMRALQDNVIGDNTGLTGGGPTWLTEIVGIVGKGRVMCELFGIRPLPDVGMTISYPKVTATPSVAAQASEGDEVSSTAKFTVGTGTFTVQTLAGGQNVSLQLALRSSPEYVDSLWRMYALQYATAYNTASWTALLAGISHTAVEVGGTSTAADYWAAFVSAAAKVMAAAPYVPPEMVVCAVNVWEILAGFVDSDGRPVFPAFENGPTNAAGQTNLMGGPGNVGGLRWYVDPGAPDDSLVVANRFAFVPRESAGAPLQLSLTKPATLEVEAAVYGFAGFEMQYPGAACDIVDAA